MSSITKPLNDTGPHHHLHGDTEPLPGSKGGTDTIDYTPETMGQTRLPPSEEGSITQDLRPRTEARYHRHDSTRASSDMDDNLPQQTMKHSIGDKIVGKTEEIAGKVTRNPQLQEKGAERAHGDTTI